MGHPGQCHHCGTPCRHDHGRGNFNVTLTVKVTNSGLLAANSAFLSVSPVVSGGAAVNQVSAVPSSVPSIAANGGTAFFTFVYKATAPGYVNFLVQSTGTDSVQQQSSIDSLPNTIAVQAQASLIADMQITNVGNVSVGQVVTIALTVTNNGAVGLSATALNLSGLFLSHGGPSIALPVGAASPSGVSLAPGASQTFIYTVTTTGTGNLYFLDGGSGVAQGFDANTGAPIVVDAANSNSITVQAPGSLASNGPVQPATVTVGDTFTVTMTVSNQGGATENNVTGFMQPDSGGQPVVLRSAPTPVASLASGAAVTFTWTFSAVGTNPNIVFSSVATGQDANTLLANNTGQFIGAAIVVQNPPSLSSSLTVRNTGTPSSGCEFDPIFVVMKVTNALVAPSTAAAIVTPPGTPFLFGITRLPYAGTTLHQRGLPPRTRERRGRQLRALYLDFHGHRRLQLQLQQWRERGGRQ